MKKTFFFQFELKKKNKEKTKRKEKRKKKMMKIIVIGLLFITHIQADPVIVVAEKNSITKQTLPGMIFLPVFIILTIIFIIFRTAFQAIYDRRKRPLNPSSITEHMNFD